MSLVVCSPAAVLKGAHGRNVELGLSVGVLHFDCNSFVITRIARVLPNKFCDDKVGQSQRFWVYQQNRYFRPPQKGSENVSYTSREMRTAAIQGAQLASQVVNALFICLHYV